MALVHERLYQGKDLSSLLLGDYLAFLARNLFQSYGAGTRGIRLEMDVPNIFVNIDTAIPLGLIMNVLITNSLHHAFPEKGGGKIEIVVKKVKETLEVRYHDNGCGIPPDLDWRNTRTLGMRMVQAMVQQLGGTIELDRSQGTTFSLMLREKGQGSLNRKSP